jgi:hypothetical protein
MTLYNLTLGLAVLLFFVYAIYWVDDKWKRTARRRRAIKDGTFVTHSGPTGVTGRTGGANNGGAWRNRTWKPNPGFNDEFAGAIPGTCGQIRPGEWQCNCIDKDAGCRVLIRLKNADEPAEERTDRRGAIAAQKARKRNGS